MGVAGFRREQTVSPTPVELDPSQRAVVDLPDAESATVLGAPGTGKTTTILEMVADRIQSRGWDASQVLVLTTARTSAARLRDALAARTGRVTTGPLARTVNSLAFELVGKAANAAGQPAPRLITGGEQDADIGGLLEGHIETDSGPRWPEELTPQVRSTRRFRTELRELMARATEYDVNSTLLRELAKVHGRPEWSAAADFIDEYGIVIAQARPTQLDSAELARFAIAAIEAEEPPELVRDLKLVILDDGQEATAGSLGVLRALAARGIAVVVFGDPDVAVNSFRGGEPDVLGRLGTVLGLPGMRRLTLDRSHRQGALLGSITSAVTERIGAAGAAVHRHPAAGGPEDGTALRVDATTPARQWAAVARQLRERHLRDGVPWDSLAVVVRSRAQVETVRRALARAEVPVRTPAASGALRDDPAARALLRLVEVGVGRVELTPDVAEELLVGPFGGLDPLELRRLRRALRLEELAGDGLRAGSQLVAEALNSPAGFATIDHRIAKRASRLAATIASLRETDTSIEELLWIAWDRSGRAEKWREQALGNGIIADEANRNLDGIVALFTAAKRFSERRPADSPQLFLEAVLDADVPEDTLSPQPHDRAVLVTTPPGVLGLQFDTVVVAGLQDGVWPDLRLRGSLLHPDALVRAMAGLDDGSLDLRKLVRDDELRMFALAVSRASHRLVLTAVSNDDEAPSPFFGILPELPSRRAGEPSPMTLRGMTGSLRRRLADPGAPLRAEAASTLASLAAGGIAAASPDRWHGLLGPSTTRPLYDGEEVHVSPSAIENVVESPLDWFVSKVSGGPSGVSANVGTLIHAAMENAPPHLDDLWKVVEERWEELLFEAHWLAERQRRLARGYTEALAEYLADFAAAGSSLVAPELSFRLAVGGAFLNGKVDRVERTANGEIVIVDLKTGRVVGPTAAQTHPQLLAYQLAYEDGAFDEVLAESGDHRPGGAKLLFVKQGRGDRRYREEHQAPLSPERLAEFRAEVEHAAMLVAAAEFDGAIEVDDYDFDVANRRLIRVRAVTSD